MVEGGGGGGEGGGVVIPYPCKSKRRYPLGNTHGEELGEKLAPFPALFVGKKTNVC